MKVLPFLICCCQCIASIFPHLKKVEGKGYLCSPIPQIDLIYLINLDQRPEKWEKSLDQLIAYGIFPHRFSAIYGWQLPSSVYEEIGVKFMPGMWIGIENALYVPPNGGWFFVRLSEEFYGKTVFSSWLTPGALGCTLSHLSILKDAQDSGYETIWVLEDDFVLEDDPLRLSEFIDELDAQVGSNGWDILYTDLDYLRGLDESKDLLQQMPYKWRPDMPDFDLHALLEHVSVGENFLKIGSRLMTHSMIIRRSGIEKILNFYRDHGLFLPYDHELGFIPDMRCYVLKSAITSNSQAFLFSDTKDRHFFSR